MAEKKDEAESASKDDSVFGSALALLLGVGLLYVGGWSLVWDQPMFTTKALVLESHGFAVRVNELYYGASFTNRFFDSPVVSWLCIMFALGLKPVGIVLLGGSEDEYR